LRPFDAQGVFQLPASEAGGWRRLAVRGAGATVLSGGLGQVIQIAATVVLARLLAPADFGVITMVTTFSLLLVNFGLNGFTEAVLQREEMDHFLASNLFWINLGGGVLLTAGFAAAAPVLGRFYGNPHVAGAAVGLSASIAITSASVLHLALLKRAMRFSAVSANDVVSRAVAVSASILLAEAGWGYKALVVGAVAQSLSVSLGAFFLCHWVPGLPCRAAGTASMVRFSTNVYGRFSLNYIARNTDNVLVGCYFNAEALGFYKKAYDVFSFSAGLLVQSLTGVAVSALSRLRRDPEEYKVCVLGGLSIAAFLGMGLGGGLTLIGKDVIRLLLGPAWAPAGRIFTLFGPGIGVMFIYGVQSWIHLSIGRADRWFRWTVVELAVTGLLFIVGLRSGPGGVAVAWTASLWILVIPALWYAGRPIHFEVGPVLSAVWRYIVASVVAGCGTAVFIGGPQALAASWLEAAARIAKVSSLFGIFYIGVVILLYRGCAPLRQVLSVLRQMVPTRRFSYPEPEQIER
jgi:O-antigen/teichoic acid export membrane protein